MSRHPARVTIKTGVTKDGKLVARQCLIHMETGAYADAGPRVTQKAGYRCFGRTVCRTWQTDAYTVYTNTVPAGAYRGFGTSASDLGVRIADGYYRREAGSRSTRFSGSKIC